MKGFETRKTCACSTTAMYWFPVDRLLKTRTERYYPVWCLDCHQVGKMPALEEANQNFTGWWKDFISHPTQLSK